MSFDERGLFQLDYEGMIERGALESDTTTDNDRDEVVASTLELHSKQGQFMDAISSGEYNYLVYGGAIQGGKTTVALTAVFLLAKIYPGSRWAITRKDLSTLKRNTLPSFNRVRPVGFASEMSRSDWTCRCANGSEIFFFAESIDIDPDHDRWKGLLVNGFVFEEMNELNEKTFHKAMERAGTWKVPGAEQPRPLIIGTCNPTKNWVLHKFYAPWKEGRLEKPYFFLPAGPSDNPHLSKSYLESLKNLPPNEYKRFVKGDWDVLDDPDQLIKFEWLVNAKMNVEPEDGPARLGVDVARYGDDYSSMAHRVGNTLMKLERWHGFSTTQSGEKVGKVIALEKVDPAKVFVDVVGLGAGTVDWLHEHGFKVTDENGGSSSSGAGGFFKFKNRRSQLWWNLRESLRLGQISINNNVDTQRLFEDLTVPKYTITADKTITVESKDSLKKRLNRSPDEGDAVVLAWADIGAVSFSDITLPGVETKNHWSVS